MDRGIDRVQAHAETFEIICKACETARPKERFRPYPNGGFEPTCRDCLNDRQREKRPLYMIDDRRQNPAFTRAANQARDSEKCREQARARRKANPERARESGRRSREQHREELRDYQRTYRLLRRESP